jgi:hypothetical protein
MDKNKIFLESEDAFNKELNLYHYTNIDALFKIVNSKRFRLTRIDKISDTLEIKYINNIWKERTYIGCFTNSYKNELIWDNYSNNSTGVCIDFGKIEVTTLKFYDEDNNEYEKILEMDKKYSSYNHTTDFRLRSVSGLKVIYANDPELLAVPDKELLDFFDGVQDVNDRDGFYKHPFQGYIKESRLFEYEKEFRIRVALLPKGIGTTLTFKGQVFHSPPSNYIYMGVKLENLKVYIKKENDLHDVIVKFCSSNKIEVITL